MDADTEEFWSLPQLSASLQLYRAGPEARAFLSMLATAMASEVRLTDMPNIHGLPNLPGFVDHRHDQSVLTILARQHGAAIFRDPSRFWDDPSAPPSETPFGQIVYLHRSRNRSYFRWLYMRLRQDYTGGRGFL
jgi:hypothetical protein